MISISIQVIWNYRTQRQCLQNNTVWRTFRGERPLGFVIHSLTTEQETKKSSAVSAKLSYRTDTFRNGLCKGLFIYKWITENSMKSNIKQYSIIYINFLISFVFCNRQEYISLFSHFFALYCFPVGISSPSIVWKTNSNVRTYIYLPVLVKKFNKRD